MTQVTGKVRVRVNGEEVPTVGNGSGTVGGATRNTVKGGDKIHGFQEDIEEPTVSFTIAHTANTSVKQIADWKDATVMIETDIGVRFIYREAWTSEPPELDHNSGEISVSMAAIDCEEDA